MAPRETVICIGCPLGCRVTVIQDKKGKVTGMKGAECRQGEKYVLKELQNPVRTLTATVRTGDDGFPLLPVRTSRPVLKTLLKPIMGETARIKVKPPIQAGDVIAKNVFKSRADLIATMDWPGSAGEG
jgi:CxxC motif-containing protein